MAPVVRNLTSFQSVSFPAVKVRKLIVMVDLLVEVMKDHDRELILDGCLNLQGAVVQVDELRLLGGQLLLGIDA